MTVPLEEREHYLYRAFDRYKRLLYVGRSCDVANRLSTHASASAWWTLMETHTIEGPMTFAAVQVAERCAIDTGSPLYNADAPDRGSTRGRRDEIVQATLSFATRDGWHMNDAWDIALATANRLIPDFKVGTQFNINDYFKAKENHSSFMSDQIAHVFHGYRQLIEGGWIPNPELKSRPLHRFIPERWNTTILGPYPSRRL